MVLLKSKAAIKEVRPHMKLNLKSTIAAPAGNKSGQRALNGIIGNTKRGIVVDKTLDPDSNNPVANKPVSTALAALAGQLAKGQVVFLDQLPESGEPHKVYVLTATNQRYWWDGNAFVKIVPTASGSANIISNDMIHYTAEEGKVYDKLVFPNGDKYAQYFPLEGDVGTSYYYRAKRVDFSENEDEPDKISLSYIKFLLDGGKIKRSSVDADLPKYEAFEGVQTKANNSLQKPEITPTKTELVGVGANGQENIEIGDNLTLANGKLSATGGGSTLGRINMTQLDLDNLTGTYTGTIDTNTLKVDTPLGSYTMLMSNDDYGYIMIVSETSDGNLEFRKLDMSGGEITGTKYSFVTEDLFINTINSFAESFQPKIYSHFITITNSNSTFYSTFQNTSEDKLNTLDSLKTALAGKYLICTGHTDSDTAEYISGENGNIVVGVVDNSDHSTSGITIDSSYTISDDVSPVE